MTRRLALPRPAPRPLCRAHASRQRTACTVAIRSDGGR